jgi:TPR repeat protein
LIARDSAAAARYFKLSADEGSPADTVKYAECLLSGDGIRKI